MELEIETPSRTLEIHKGTVAYARRQCFSCRRARSSRAVFWRRCGSIVLGMLTATVLTGCTPEAPIFARIVDGQVAFSICQGIDLLEIRVETFPEGDTSNSTVVWRAKGSTAVPEGFVLTYGETPEGWSTELPAETIDLGSKQIYLALDGASEDGNSDVLVAEFSGASLTEDSWVNQVGTETQEACR